MIQRKSPGALLLKAPEPHSPYSHRNAAWRATSDYGLRSTDAAIAILSDSASFPAGPLAAKWARSFLNVTRREALRGPCSPDVGGRQ